MILKKDNGKFGGETGIGKVREQRFRRLGKPIDQNGIDERIRNALLQRDEVRATSDNLYMASGQKIFQTSASQRGRCDDEDADHAATELRAGGLPGCALPN